MRSRRRCPADGAAAEPTAEHAAEPIADPTAEDAAAPRPVQLFDSKAFLLFTCAACLVLW